MSRNLRNDLTEILNTDVNVLEAKCKEYGDSWKRRGGVGAWMMLARKWDRLSEQIEQKSGYDMFKAGLDDTRPEGVLDDIQDLRRYLALVEDEINHLRKPIKDNPHIDPGYEKRLEEASVCHCPFIGGPHPDHLHLKALAPRPTTSPFPPDFHDSNPHTRRPRDEALRCAICNNGPSHCFCPPCHNCKESMGYHRYHCGLYPMAFLADQVKELLVGNNTVNLQSGQTLEINGKWLIVRR